MNVRTAASDNFNKLTAKALGLLLAFPVHLKQSSKFTSGSSEVGLYISCSPVACEAITTPSALPHPLKNSYLPPRETVREDQGHHELPRPVGPISRPGNVKFVPVQKPLPADDRQKFLGVPTKGNGDLTWSCVIKPVPFTALKGLEQLASPPFTRITLRGIDCPAELFNLLF